MSARKLIAALVAVAIVGSVFAPAATAAQTNAYGGSHIAFDTTNNAVVDYSVDGDTVFESVKVQSKSTAESNSGIEIGGDLAAVTGFVGAAVSVEASSTTSATVTAESGATLTAHDNHNGILVVRSGSNSQFVEVNVSSESEVHAESDGRVVVESASGTTGTFIVVGDGDVTVNEDGNVSAELASHSKLVFRTYPEGRDEADKTQEKLIAEGKAAASVYVMQKSDSSSETVVDVVQYSQNTSVEVTQRTESSVTMSAERAKHEGKIIITSVSKAVIESTDDMSVMVSGNAAVRASSYSELESAIGSDTSKFMVQQESSVDATADVLVSVNHFSERQVTMQDSSEDGDTGTATTSADDSPETTTSGSTGPGFGVVLAVLSIVAVAIAALYRS